MIYRLNPYVVNLRRHNVKFRTSFFDTARSTVIGWMVQGLSFQRGRVGESDRIDMVETGMIVDLDIDQIRFQIHPSEYLRKIKSASERPMAPAVRQSRIEEYDPFLDIDRQSLQYLDSVTERVLVTLLDHHVKGEEIIKGYKVYRSNFEGVKITENYLGGWNVIIDGESVTTGQLISLINGR